MARAMMASAISHTVAPTQRARPPNRPDATNHPRASRAFGMVRGPRSSGAGGAGVSGVRTHPIPPNCRQANEARVKNS